MQKYFVKTASKYLWYMLQSCEEIAISSKEAYDGLLLHWKVSEGFCNPKGITKIILLNG